MLKCHPEVVHVRVMRCIARTHSPVRLLLAWTGLVVAFFALAVTPVALTVTPAAAENPGDLLPELADDGVYIASSRSSEADPGMFLPVIERARADGVSMAVLWPDNPQPNTGAFARRIQEASLIDVVLVFGPDGAFGSFVSEDYEEASIRASAAARVSAEPTTQASAYLTGLLEEPVRERPAIVNELVRWIVILLVALVAGAVGEQMIRQFKKSRQRRKLQMQGETAG